MSKFNPASALGKVMMGVVVMSLTAVLPFTLWGIWGRVFSSAIVFLAAYCLGDAYLMMLKRIQMLETLLDDSIAAERRGEELSDG